MLRSIKNVLRTRGSRRAGAASKFQPRRLGFEELERRTLLAITISGHAYVGGLECQRAPTDPPLAIPRARMPLRGVVVEATLPNNQTVTGSTAADGSYSITIPAQTWTPVVGQNVAVRFYARASASIGNQPAYTVCALGVATPYRSGDTLVRVTQTTGTITAPDTSMMWSGAVDGRTGGFAIASILYTYYHFAADVLAVNFSQPTTFHYPLLQAHSVSTETDVSYELHALFEKVDTIGHEFGHRVLMASGLSTDVFAPDHQPGVNQRTYRRPSQGQTLTFDDQAFTFEEGWCNYFSVAAPAHYGNAPAGTTALHIPALNDHRYRYWRDEAASIDMDIPGGSGEDDEKSIMHVLWGLDRGNTELDITAMGPRGLFDAFRAQTTPTLISVWNSLTYVNYDPRVCATLGTLFMENNVSPRSIGSDIGPNGNFVTFKIRNCSDEDAYVANTPILDTLQVRVYRDTGNGWTPACNPLPELNLTGDLAAQGLTIRRTHSGYRDFAYEIPAAAWTQIVAASAQGRLYVAVVGRCSAASGYNMPFWSGARQLNIRPPRPTSFNANPATNALALGYDVFPLDGVYPSTMPSFTLDLYASPSGSFDDPAMSGSLVNYSITGTQYLTATDENDSDKTVELPVSSSGLATALAQYASQHDEYYLVAKIHSSDDPTGERDSWVRFEGGAFQTADGRIYVQGGANLDTETPEDVFADDFRVQGLGSGIVQVAWTSQSATWQFDTTGQAEAALDARLHDGDDNLLVMYDPGVPVAAYGGSGDDHLSASSYCTAGVYFQGDSGANILEGGGGDDILRGGLADFLYGNGGSDKLIVDCSLPDAAFASAGSYNGGYDGDTLEVVIPEECIAYVQNGAVTVPGLPPLPYTSLESQQIEAQAGSVLVVDGTTLALDNNSTISPEAQVVVVGGGTLNLGGYMWTVASVTLVDGSITNGTISADNYVLISGEITADMAGSGGVTKIGDGSAVLSGSNTFTGNIMIDQGSLRINSGALPLGRTVLINEAGTLEADGAYDPANWLAIDAISVDSCGTFALTGNYTGTLNMATTGYPYLYLGAIGTVVYSGALTPYGDQYLLGGGGGTLIAQTPLVDDGTTPRGVLVRGNVVFDSTYNAYTGDTEINAGITEFSYDCLPGTTILINYGGMLKAAGEWTGVADCLGDVSVDSTGTVLMAGDESNISMAGYPWLSLGSDGNHTCSGTLDAAADWYFLGGGPGTLNVQAKLTDGASATGVLVQGSVVFSNTLNDYSGPTEVLAGELALGASGVIPHGTGKGDVTVDYGAVLNLAGHDLTINGLWGDGSLTNIVSSTASNTLTIGDADGDSTFGGTIQDGINETISGTVALAKIGNGTLALNGMNTYQGGTTIYTGCIQCGSPWALGGRSAAGTNNLVMYAGARLDLNAQNGVMVDGLSGDGGSITDDSDIGGGTLDVALDPGGDSNEIFNGSFIQGMQGMYGSLRIDVGSGVTGHPNSLTFTGPQLRFQDFQATSDAAVPGTVIVQQATGQPAPMMRAETLTVDWQSDDSAGGSAFLWNSPGTLTVTGGSLTVDEGVFDAQAGTVQVTNSTVLVAGASVVPGGGVLRVSGGNVLLTNSPLYVGTADYRQTQTPSPGVLDVQAGRLEVTDDADVVLGADGAPGLVTIAPAAVVEVNGTGQIDLMPCEVDVAGVLATARPLVFAATDPDAGVTVNFSGGTLQALADADTTPLIAFGTHAYAHVYVGQDGMTFDSNGYSVKIAQGLEAYTGATNRSLTKTGEGTLTLTGDSTYDGGTVITTGKLTLTGSTGSILADSDLTFTGPGTFIYDNVGASGAISLTLGTLSFSTGEGTVLTKRSETYGTTLTFDSLAGRPAGVVGTFALEGAGATPSANRIQFSTAPGSSGQFLDQGLFFDYDGDCSYAVWDSNGFLRPMLYSGAPDTDCVSRSGGTDVGSSTGKHVETIGEITAQTSISLNTLNISGANDFTLGDAAVLTLSAGGLLKAGGNAATLSGGEGAAIDNDDVELVVRADAAGDDLTIATAITGDGALVKAGAGNVTLSGANDYSGGTVADLGQLVVASADALPAGGGLTIAAGATVVLASGLGEEESLRGGDWGEETDTGGESDFTPESPDPQVMFLLRPVEGGTGDYSVSGDGVTTTYSVTIHSRPGSTATLQFELYVAIQGSDEDLTNEGLQSARMMLDNSPAEGGGLVLSPVAQADGTGVALDADFVGQLGSFGGKIQDVTGDGAADIGGALPGAGGSASGAISVSVGLERLLEGLPAWADSMLSDGFSLVHVGTVSMSYDRWIAQGQTATLDARSCGQQVGPAALVFGDSDKAEGIPSGIAMISAAGSNLVGELPVTVVVDLGAGPSAAAADLATEPDTASAAAPAPEAVDAVLSPQPAEIGPTNLPTASGATNAARDGVPADPSLFAALQCLTRPNSSDKAPAPETVDAIMAASL